ncbi:hypothetical protein EYC84_000516 [Monilinia fructicola]|uniref:D-malate dehydrogenase (decarboxylating) n=1 Tax=Monilinia fructicola TaxID=38448 RepID=A0A5M9JNU0_MONFR|nr:hypothetical protein EYC84_000516 [Monilinia fructicola]
MPTSNQSNSSNVKSYKIASIPGDGIGPDVISAGIKILDKLTQELGTFSLEFTHFDWSSAYYKKYGKYLPDDALEVVRGFEALFFGCVGDVEVPDHISLWGLRLALCQPLQQYANVRPTRILRGITSPLKNCERGDLDWVIIRENSEGEYAGHGGISHKGEKWAVATETSVFTRVGVERIMRFAFETARGRERKHLTVVTKSNAQRNGMVFWDEVAEEVGREFKDVKVEKMLVDGGYLILGALLATDFNLAMTTKMVLQPQSIDTIVATNLHADILSDLAAALAGSIGIAPTSNLDPTRNNPSMFEPIHGSAFDLVGKGVANPVGTFWSAAEMLRWLGEGDAADLLMESVENVLESGVKTLDLGGQAKTQEVVDAVCAEIEVVVRKIKGN